MSVSALSHEISTLEEAQMRIEELEQELIWEKRLLHTIIENLSSAVYAKDTEGRKILTNIADCKNVGAKSADEVIGKTDFDMFPHHIARAFTDDDNTVLKQGKSIIDREELLKEKNNGVERWLRTSKIPLRDDDGNIVGLVGFGHDISVEKQLEKENITSAAQLQEQQALMEKTLADLAAIPDKIGKLVNGISYIAKQTKMVSINAAIEAARVGEQGRGFEVVAHEVGQLSDRSNEAATQVRTAIAEVDSLVEKILEVWKD